MKQLILTILLICPIGMYAQQLTEHTVANGETLQSIAAKYNVSVPDLKESNSGLDDYVFTGMVLKIPAAKDDVKVTEVVPIDDLKDVIYLKDGSELVAKILTVGKDSVSFEQYDTDEPFILSKDKIISIAFEDGRVTNFTSTKKKSTTKRRRR